jgi:catechol 2,3-dioxygenase-like lactoylglutathione lyase family enzyme
MRSLALFALALFCSAPFDRPPQEPATPSDPPKERPVTNPNPELGAFSVSLAVKDLAKSRGFYEALGFAVVGGVPEQNWLILRNGTTTIGLFKGMLPGNSMTFNPGWDAQAKALPKFTDVRELQRRFEARGVELKSRADEASDGPAHFTLVDPDGNMLLFDQHVPRPK